MEHTRLGRTGRWVSKACLGTMTFGFQCDEDTSFAILDKAAELGVTFLDTADVYPVGGPPELRGRTEEIVGRWLAGKRDDFIVATKCVMPMGEHRWQSGASRKHVLDAVDASLRRLDIDYIDLYQLHMYDRHTPLDEQLSALDHLVRVGKVRYVGVSNWLAYQVARSLGRSEVLGLARVDSVQPRYNLLFREVERELLPLCREESIGVIPFNPIAGGMLTGKHRGGTPTEGTRFTLGRAAELYQQRYWQERMFSTVDELSGIAADAGMPLAQLAVAWVAANPAITAPIIGASRPEQLDATVAGCTTVLDPELRQVLDDVTLDYRRGDADR